MKKEKLTPYEKYLEWVIKEQEKEIKRLNEQIEDCDRWEDYWYERCMVAEKQLLKIKCFINDEDYPYEK